MCPACLGIAAAHAAGAGSVGGVTTLLLKRLLRRATRNAPNISNNRSHIAMARGPSRQ